MEAAAGDKLATEIERIVTARIAAGRLVVPALPTVATTCLDLLREPEFAHRRLVAQIEGEPLLAALIVRAANGAAYGTPVSGIDQAVQRLGAQRLKTLIVEYASRQLFRSTNRAIDDAARMIWVHSVAVANLARDIAALAGNPDADGCYLAGLLHDIGKPVVAAMLLEAERSVGARGARWIESDAWTATVERTHRAVGVAIATEWQLPEQVTAAIRDCSDYDVGNRGSIANLVRLANAVAKREGFAAGPVDATDVDAMIMLGRSILGADEDAIARLAHGLQERISERS
jgi:putative nucleotidyltransferase with HDIG domain